MDRKALAAAMVEALMQAPESVLRREVSQQGRGLPGSVTIRLVDDQEIADLNARYLGKIGPTDVLAFPMFDSDPRSGRLHWGDIVVSVQTAARVAGELGIPETEEVLRYILHGFLHLIGYDDADAEGRKRMMLVQERLVRLIAGKGSR